MPIRPTTLPTAGPFDLGSWNGHELVLSHRRWFPAILTWILAALIALWVVAGVVFPKSDFVPEADSFPIILGISAAFAVIGCLIALWSRTFRIAPADKRIVERAGFPIAGAEQVIDADGMWLQVHPIAIRLKAKGISMTWQGFAAVVHASGDEGVIIAAKSSQEEAAARAQERSLEMRINCSSDLGPTLNAHA